MTEAAHGERGSLSPHPGAAVRATRAALEAIQDLEAAHGPIMLFQSGGCCEGSAPMCLRRDELLLSPHDICLGQLAGTPFYIDADQYERWNRPQFLIDVSAGPAEGFSLEGSMGVHFVTRTLQ
jgi:uncharacterized protein (DUF779 family)